MMRKEKPPKGMEKELLEGIGLRDTNYNGAAGCRSAT